MKKRIKALVLAVMMFASLLVIDTPEAHASATEGLSVSNSEVHPGEFVELAVNVPSLDDLAYMDLWVGFDSEAVELVEIQAKEISGMDLFAITDGYAVANKDEEFGIMAADADGVALGNGYAATAVFRVKDAAEGVYTFTAKTWDVEDVDGNVLHTLKTDTVSISLTIPKNPLLITKQPTDVTVEKGTRAQVTVEASGDGLKYAWYYKDKSASAFKLTTTFTTGTYKMDMTEERAGRQVYCVITDAYGKSVQTDTVTLNMAAELKITKQPTNVTAAEGERVKVSFTAEGDGLTYNWYYKDKSASEFKHTTSFKSNSYTIDMTEDRAGRQVYCVVTDAYGKTVQTDTVTFNMAVRITKQPTNVTAAEGERVKVSFTAEGDGLTYKWYFKDKSASEFKLTTSFKSNSYTIDMTSARAGRQVYCVVTDAYGNTVQTDTVTFNMAAELKITKQPTNVTAAEGERVKVSFTAEGDGLTYKWYYKDKSASKFSLTTSFKSNSYTIDMTSARAGRQVYCVVTDAYGNTVQTDTVTFNMGTKLEITKQPVNVMAASGERAKVTFEVKGDGLTYKWYFKDKSASKFSLTTSFKSNSYTIDMTSARAGRQVYCVVTDAYGNSVQTDTVTLSMGTALKITKQPVSVTAASGTKAKVTVEASGDGLTYKWYYKDKSASKFTLTTSFKSNSYYIDMTSARAGRQVYCVITDQYGNTVQTDTVTLSMGTTLKITKQPVSVTVASGTKAKVTVSATGDGLKYEWYYKDKSASKFALTTSFKSNSYYIDMTSARAGRQVYCVITDAYGSSVQTSTVTLNMK